MEKSDIDQCAKLIADQYHLRWLDVSRRYVGFHCGVILDLVTDDQFLHLNFLVHGPDWHALLKSDYRDLKETLNHGVSDSWLYPALKNERTFGCRISMNADRIERLGVRALVEVPDILITDLHRLGVPANCPCQICHCSEASNVTLVDYTLFAVCDQCLLVSRQPVLPEALQAVSPVNWPLTLPTLAAMTTIGTLLWAGIQTSKEIHVLYFLLPVVWAFGLCRWVVSVAGGVNLMLRAMLFLSVLTSVMIGNIWGYRALMIRKFRKDFPGIELEYPWIDAVWNYITNFPRFWADEIPYYLGGIAGALIAFYSTRERDAPLIE